MRGCISEAAQAAERSLAPAAGMMAQAVWFDAGADVAGRLLLTIHHLAVDGVSWRILLPDLAAAWQAIANGREPTLPARSTSFRRWAQRLAVDAQDAERVGELSFWTGMLASLRFRWSRATLDPDRDTGGTARHLTLTLPAALTGALLTRVPAAFHGGINDVLLAGLVVARGLVPAPRPGWRAKVRITALLLDLEGHGREDIFADADLSRTVGWFTSLFPVRLDPGAIDLDEAMAGGAALGRAVKTIKEQLRALPDNGLGYGLLRYLNRGRVRGLPAMRHRSSASIISDASRLRRRGLGAAPEDVRLAGGDLPLAHALEVNAFTLDNAEGAKLTATWSWAPALVSEAEVRDLGERWFQALKALVRHARRPAPAGARRPICRWLRSRRARSSRLERQYPQIEDILPLSPLQEGLLFHALYDAQAPDVYTVQLDLGLEGPLDGAALEAAAQALVQRHASLRASFRHENLSRPVANHPAAGEGALASHRSVIAGRRGTCGSSGRHPGAGSRRALRSRRCAAAALHADPAGARPASARLTNHHILMDGWSMPVLVQELLALYARRGRGAAAGDALSRLSRLDRGAGSRRGDRGSGETRWTGLEAATHVAAHDPGRAPIVPEQTTLAPRRDADRGADACRAPAGPDAEHIDPGGVGDSARPHDRTRRRGVRRDRRRPAAGDRRHRAHGGAVHQHAAAAHQAAAGKVSGRDLA